ncbi:MAG: PAS domain-containing protein [Alphaproteobacteria bacterium]|nr:PAS domain-containing protein [Alphaproteobacteria bacterium]MCW5740659.1 PAS domain-containing protein [Alphaproteobacteria bacterium]
MRDAPISSRRSPSGTGGSELQRLQEWLELARQSAGIVLWEWDTRAGLFRISDHWHEEGSVGQQAGSISLDQWLQLVHVEDRPTCERFLASLANGAGVPQQAEFRVRRPDGSFAWQRGKGRMMPGPRGAGGSVIGVLVEITAEREALEHRHQIDRLEAVGQLTGGLAHDFNNLLTVIQGNVDLLHDDLGDDAASAAILSEISAVVDRGAAVTRRLLRFARSDLPAKTVFNPDRLLRGLLPLLAHTLGGTVALHMNLAARGAAVSVDTREFENAIINLAINARDAMPAGGTLALSTRQAWLQASDVDVERGEAPGAYVEIALADTGHGMPPDVLSRIYEPFFTTKADKGTGLGVPMVARFVRHSAGCMRVESAVGTGTTVRLYLPLPVADE